MSAKLAAVLFSALLALSACASTGSQNSDADPNAESKPFDHELDVRGGGG